MITRSATAADLDRVLAWTVEAPVSWVAADMYRAEAAEQRHRPEWIWIAEDEAGRVLARAVWWGRTDSERQAVLAEVTRMHAERGAARITATTDLGNAPMAAAFGRAGYRNVQARIVLSAPTVPYAGQ